MNVEAPDSRLEERFRHRGEKESIGGDRQIIEPGDDRELAHQNRKIASHEGLASGQPNVTDSDSGE